MQCLFKNKTALITKTKRKRNENKAKTMRKRCETETKTKKQTQEKQQSWWTLQTGRNSSKRGGACYQLIVCVILIRVMHRQRKTPSSCRI